MKTIAIIPARLGSGRFKNKPLADICGKTMIQHCYLRTKMSRLLTETVVATPNQEIVENIKSVGGKAILTPEFDMCNDRIAWAYNAISKHGDGYDFVINVQGDQPLVYPEMVDQIIETKIAEPQFKSITMVEPVKSIDDFIDLNRVKVIFSERDNSLIYMSRAGIPSPKTRGILPEKVYKHVALIGFEPKFLNEFLDFGMTYNETVEGIDYNRVVEMGEKMKVLVTKICTDTVDTPQDLERVQGIMVTDQLWLSKTY